MIPRTIRMLLFAYLATTIAFVVASASCTPEATRGAIPPVIDGSCLLLQLATDAGSVKEACLDAAELARLIAAREEAAEPDARETGSQVAFALPVVTEAARPPRRRCIRFATDAAGKRRCAAWEYRDGGVREVLAPFLAELDASSSDARASPDGDGAAP